MTGQKYGPRASFGVMALLAALGVVLYVGLAFAFS